MDVFLIPTTTSERYQLYYEAPDSEVVDADEGSGLIHRLKLRFNEMLREAEEWRHRRHEAERERAGFITKWRRKVMAFVVERIAEQRLLWHLRKATGVCAHIPTDLSDSDADFIVRASLLKDSDHHRKWLWIDGTLLLLSAPLVLIPGPNIPGFYFTFQVVGHYLSWRGAKAGLMLSPWTFKPCEELAEVRAAFAMAPVQRQRRFHELARRLRLERLPTFLEQVAAPPA